MITSTRKNKEKIKKTFMTDINDLYDINEIYFMIMNISNNFTQLEMYNLLYETSKYIYDIDKKLIIYNIMDNIWYGKDIYLGYSLCEKDFDIDANVKEITKNFFNTSSNKYYKNK